MRFLSDDWCSLKWTAFAPLRDVLSTTPKGPGVYRVRVIGRDALAYIGQTGRSLWERLTSLSRNAYRDECPFNDPHTAACRLWSYRDFESMDFECSGAELQLNERYRKAWETLLIWHYRVETGASPLCNFGRLHPQYVGSRNRSTGFRGGRLPDGQFNAANAESLPALLSQGTWSDMAWMGCDWSKWVLLHTSMVVTARGPGLYRIADSGMCELAYIGEAVDLRSRLLGHARALDGRVMLVSFATLPAGTKKCQRLELENDLIAGYFQTTSKPPSLQFGTLDIVPTE